MTNSTLLLNADGSPISLLPLSTLSWQESVSKLYLDQAEVLHVYDDWFIHSQKLKLPVPSVMILKKQISTKKRALASGGPTAHMIFLRDGYTCQYCGKKFAYSSLTKDHIVPVCYGGKSTFENLVCACSPCNGKRGHNTKIQPLVRPYRPTYSHLIKMMKKMPIVIPHPSWNYFLGWKDELVRVEYPMKNLQLS